MLRWRSFVHTEFVKARVPRDLRSLQIFDRAKFSRRIISAAAEWHRYEIYWLTVDGRRIGCCAFEKHVDFTGDLHPERENPHLEGSVYTATTGILPAFQGRGFGQLLKAWEIAWAAHNGFTRIVTNTRRRNRAMIALNRKSGFRVIRTTPRYYDDPVDATVVMARQMDRRDA